MCNIHKESNLYFYQFRICNKGSEVELTNLHSVWEKKVKLLHDRQCLKRNVHFQAWGKTQGLLSFMGCFCKPSLHFHYMQKIGRQGERDLTPASSYWPRKLFADWQKIGSNFFHIYLLWVRYGTHTMARTQRSEDNLKMPLLPGSLA